MPCCRSQFLCVVAIVLPLCWLGCKPPTAPSTGASSANATDEGHDHANEEEIPADFATGVTELEKLHQKIAAAYHSNEPAAAEESLHAVGHLLEHLPDLAQKAGIEGDALASVKASVRVLFDAYYALDSAIHEGKPGDFASVERPLSDALGQLKSVKSP